MPNSSSSKYVKRHRHRHTKSRRHAKKYTIKKVMRGCSSKQYGGNSGVEVKAPHNTSPAQLETLKGGSSNLLKLQAFKDATGGSPSAFTQITPMNYAPTTTTTTTTNVQGGGYKSKHRRHRYKKSIGRRGRSRRFRGSRK